LLETKYTKILENLTTFADKKLKSPKANMVVVERLSKFIDAYIDDAIGDKPIVEAEKMARLTKFYDMIREQVQFSNDEMQTTIAKKVSEVDKELKTVKEALNTEIAGKMTIVQENNKFKKEELLSNELAGKRKVIVEKIRTQFKDADLKLVTESIKTAIKTAEDDIDADHANEAEKVNKDKHVDGVIKESSTLDPEHSQRDVMDVYAEQLNQRVKMGI